MRHAAGNIHGPLHDRGTPEDGPSTGFVILAVVCAAVMVAIFALHGGGGLLGDRFDRPAIATFGEPAR